MSYMFRVTVKWQRIIKLHQRNYDDRLYLCILKVSNLHTSAAWQKFKIANQHMVSVNSSHNVEALGRSAYSSVSVVI